MSHQSKNKKNQVQQKNLKTLSKHTIVLFFFLLQKEENKTLQSTVQFFLKKIKDKIKKFQFFINKILCVL